MTFKQSAKNALKNCLRVKPGESVLVVTDVKKFSLGRAFFEAALELNCEAMLMLMKPRSRSGEEPPPAIAQAMKNASVVIAPTTYSITHTQARKEACAAGARIATIPIQTNNRKLLREMFTTGGITADYSEIEARAKKLIQKLNQGSVVRIESELGTDVTFELSGRKWQLDIGICIEPGSFINLPSGEVFIAPANSNGKVVIDGSFGDIGILKSPLEFHIRNNYVVEIRGRNAAQLMRKLNAIGKEARNLAELGIGLNPKAKLLGIVLEDEKVAGTAHIAIGDNSTFGGTVKAGIHWDGIIKSPKIYLDGEELKLN
ncbi:MAG: aminopeptidase [Methanocellales archaeon]